MKVVIINAYGRSNRGDAVLLDECISDVLSVWPEADIGCVVFEGIESAIETHPKIIWSQRIGNSMRFGWQAKLVTIWRMMAATLSLLPGFNWLCNMLPRSQRISWQMIRHADVVISAPGGYIHDTNFAFYVALFHIWLGQQCGGRIILAPQSIGPIDSIIARKITKMILARCTIICARESYSWNFLREKLLIPKEILRRTGDSAFWNTNISSNEVEIAAAWAEIGFDPTQDVSILGLTVVDWSFPGSSDIEKARSTYLAGLATIIDYMYNKHGMKCIVFNQVSDDLGLAKKLHAICKSQIIVDNVSRKPEILRALIARSTLFLGTRFHSCIFAMMAGCPTFAIAYLPKTSFILHDLLLEHRQIPITEFDPSAIIEILERDASNLEAARKEISCAVNSYCARYKQLRDVLREDL